MPDVFHDWPEAAPELTSPAEIQAAYETKRWAGARKDQAAEEEFHAGMGVPDFGAVVDDWRRRGLAWRNEAAGGLHLNGFASTLLCEAERLGKQGTLAQLSRDPDLALLWPESQTTGDCVSHWIRNHFDGTRASEIKVGLESEGWHVRTACEPPYGHRGHSYAGANCARLGNFAVNVGGMLLRQLYEIPGYGQLDLRKYNARIGMQWGGRGVPEAVLAECRKHQARSITRITSLEQAIDAFEAGLTIGGCSPAGYSNRKDENGVGRRQGSWGHAHWRGAMDARPETIRRYKGRLFLYVHEWGDWIDGGRRIMDTEIDIPLGCMWETEADMRWNIEHGAFYVLGGINGWEPLWLKSLGATNVRI